jgi:hypothetical protein
MKITYKKLQTKNQTLSCGTGDLMLLMSDSQIFMNFTTMALTLEILSVHQNERLIWTHTGESNLLMYGTCILASSIKSSFFRGCVLVGAFQAENPTSKTLNHLYRTKEFDVLCEKFCE